MNFDEFVLLMILFSFIRAAALRCFDLKKLMIILIVSQNTFICRNFERLLE